MTLDGWHKEKLGDLFEFKNGVNTEASNYGSGIKFVNVMDVFSSNTLTCEKIRDSVNLPEKKTNLYLLKFGDVLFNRTSEVFDEIALCSVYLDSAPAVFGGFVIRGRPISTKLDPSFCIYCFSSYNVRKELIRRGQGAIRANIGQADMRQVPLLVPPAPEQTKIANILSTWAKAIETVEKLIDNSRTQKKSLMQKLLTSKERLPGFKNAWKEVTIKQMGNVVSGGTPDTGNQTYWNEDIEWATPTDITALKSRFISKTKRKISMPGVKNSSAQLLPAGSILVCTRATIGYLAVAANEITTNQGFKSLIPNNKFYSDFVYYLFKYNKHQFIRYACGSTFLEISKKDFSQLIFSVPDIDEQKHIAQVLNNTSDYIRTLEKSKDKLILEKKALMQQLLTGKRRVKVDRGTTNASHKETTA